MSVASVSMSGQLQVTPEEQTDPSIVGFVACQRGEGPVSAGVKMKIMTPQVHGANLTFAAHFDSHFPPESTDVNYGLVLCAVRSGGGGH